MSTVRPLWVLAANLGYCGRIESRIWRIVWGRCWWREIDPGRERGRVLSVPSEASEQVVLARWLKKNRVTFFHPPNGGRRIKSEARLFRQMGVQRGVPDIIIVDPVGEHVGTVLELKRVSGGVVSSEQKKWLGVFAERGWACIVAKGARDAIAQLKELGYGVP